jgi:hypothetical protein
MEICKNVCIILCFCFMVFPMSVTVEFAIIQKRRSNEYVVLKLYLHVINYFYIIIVSGYQIGCRRGRIFYRVWRGKSVPNARSCWERKLRCCCFCRGYYYRGKSCN